MKIPFTNREITIGKTKERSSAPSISYLNWRFGVSDANVSEDGVQGIAAWYRGTQILATTIAGLPKDLYQTDGDTRRKVENHVSKVLIKRKASKNMTSYSLFEYLMYSVLNKGNGYALIGRDSNNRPIELIPIHPDRVHVQVYDDGGVTYQVTSNKNFVVDYEDIIHIKGVCLNGYVGIDPITAHKNLLGATLSSQKLNKEFYDNGTHLDGYIRMPGKFTEEAQKTLRKSWADTYSGTGKDRVAILDNDMEYRPLNSTMADAQFMETMLYMKNEVLTILGIPPSMANELGRATHNNIEHLQIQFVQYGLMQWVDKLENELNDKLLMESEKDSMYWEFNVKGLLRGDSKTQAENARLMFNIASMTPDEIRQEMNRNPLPNGQGEKTYVPLNMVALDEQDKYRKATESTVATNGSENT